ncbi:hypothetical protein AB1Y20_022979 [Prymnesium parvum]|uniref:Solute carrier family 40 protein n=1 Tax=Prymnesium parvum TaxID=97485 RepID=A0AB34JEW5_PRYPA
MLWEITPLSESSGEDRSREMSWSSVYMTPNKPPHESPERMPPAPAWVQRSARRYCTALTVAALGHGLFCSLLSPVALTLLGDDWQALAMIRGALCVGALFPVPSLLQSVQRYVRAALVAHALVWFLLLPAAFVAFGPHFVRPAAIRIEGTSRTLALWACVALALFLDGVASAVATSACSAARLEHQLRSEFEMAAPNKLIQRLRWRFGFAFEAGTIGLAPLLSVGAWAALSTCAASCARWPWLDALLAAAFALTTVLISLIAALTIHRFTPPPKPEFTPALPEVAPTCFGARRSLTLSDVIERPSGVWSESAEDWLSPPGYFGQPRPFICDGSVPLEAPHPTLHSGPHIRPSAFLQAQAAHAAQAQAIAHAAASRIVAEQLDRAAGGGTRPPPHPPTPPAPPPSLFPSHPVLSLRANLLAAAPHRGAFAACALLAWMRACEEGALLVLLPLCCARLRAPPHLWGAAVAATAAALLRGGSYLALLLRLLCRGACRWCRRRCASRNALSPCALPIGDTPVATPNTTPSRANPSFTQASPLTPAPAASRFSLPPATRGGPASAVPFAPLPRAHAPPDPPAASHEAPPADLSRHVRRVALCAIGGLQLLPGGYELLRALPSHHYAAELTLLGAALLFGLLFARPRASLARALAERCSGRQASRAQVRAVGARGARRGGAEADCEASARASALEAVEGLGQLLTLLVQVGCCAAYGLLSPRVAFWGASALGSLLLAAPPIALAGGALWDSFAQRRTVEPHATHLLSDHEGGPPSPIHSPQNSHEPYSHPEDGKPSKVGQDESMVTPRIALVEADTPSTAVLSELRSERSGASLPSQSRSANLLQADVSTSANEFSRSIASCDKENAVLKGSPSPH